MDSSFRFRPPEIATTDSLRWALSRAFASPFADAGRPPATPALECARRLGLLPRIALRIPDQQIADELGAEAMASCRRERSLAIARELRFDETLAAVGRAAGRCGIEPVLLKGRALILAGHSVRGARPSGDLDLLAPERSLPAFRDELVAEGFEQAISGSYEHQLAPLRHPEGELVELHRHVPGVCVAPRHFATWSDLDSSGLTVSAGGGPKSAGLRLPVCDFLIAHTLAHALAQNAFAARFPGWTLVADLIDLEAMDERRGGKSAPWRDWVAGELDRREIDAALELASRAAAGTIRLAGNDDDALLARHVTACAVDRDYGEALKLRWLESPVSERSRTGARLHLLLNAFVPAGGGLARARPIPWLVRPFRLARKALVAALSARRVRAAAASSGRAPEP